MYKIEYLPVAQNDLIEIVRYISHELHNPEAAKNLAGEFMEANERIAAFPYSNPIYVPIRPLEHEYRRAIVQSYMMFYRVDEEKHIVTVARVVYSKRDLKELLGE